MGFEDESEFKAVNGNSKLINNYVVKNFTNHPQGLQLREKSGENLIVSRSRSRSRLGRSRKNKAVTLIPLNA